MAGYNDSVKTRTSRGFEYIRIPNFEDTIEANEKTVNNHLKQIESEFRRHIQVAIDTCESMERLAAEDHKPTLAESYRIKTQIYRQLLDNYTLSNSYNRP